MTLISLDINSCDSVTILHNFDTMGHPQGVRVPIRECPTQHISNVGGYRLTTTSFSACFTFTRRDFAALETLQLPLPCHYCSTTAGASLASTPFPRMDRSEMERPPFSIWCHAVRSLNPLSICTRRATLIHS